MPASQPKKRNTQKSDGKLSGFYEAFYHRIPENDLEGWAAADKEAAARLMLDWALTRARAQHKVRVFHSQKETQTIIQIVNDDMPFLVDSVTAELGVRNLGIEKLLHPILGVKRNAAGRLESVRAETGNGYAPESYIFIWLDQLLNDQAAKALEQELSVILNDVRLATADWPAMLERMDAVISELSSAPPSRKNDWQEAQEFLSYLSHHNFTFLGYRAFRFTDKSGKLESKKVSGSSLGVLKNDIDLFMGEGVNSPELRALKETPLPVMITKLIDKRATVHRRVPMDAISVKMFGKDGKLAGMHLFVGLFTSSTYSCRTSDVPIARAKVQDVIRRAGFPKGTHDRTALEHILEKMPRDELLQAPVTALYETALGILRLQTRQRVALFTHMDPMRQHVSCLVYVPRERYDAQFRQQVEKLLEEALRGKATTFYTTLDDSPLARILFTVKLEAGVPAGFDAAALEARLMDAGREWDEKLRRVLINSFGKREGATLAHIYSSAFPGAYHESTAVDNAVHDVRRLETLRVGSENIYVDLYQLHNAPAGEMRLKVYHKAKPVPLADILPVLENMGLRCISEMPYEVRPQGAAAPIWIHDFVVQGAVHIVFDTVKENFEKAFLSVWHGESENDRLNQLVLLANLTWSETRILRTYNGFMRQQKFPFTRTYIEQVLGFYPDIACELVKFFKERHDPHLKTPIEKRGLASSERLEKMLQLVNKLDHDRILRGFKTLIERTLRTSYFQTDEDGKPKSYLAVKLDSKNIPDLPQPRPMVEIFLYSARVEAVHLRGGKISRGGIRWSDRHDDFRTEILGLMKAQMVKNAVIVPMGAKGGFIVKQPPAGDRVALQNEGVECYRIFVQGMLDLTDNNIKGKIVRPKNVVCYDEEDPYLVVAADKGTATFSNIANLLSQGANFWLQDAFASGGSTGYDHKEIAITARGGWECVKRHFREIGKNIQKEDFTVVGVGDMSGDVFGNAMLLSPHIGLVGAFNHLHIFCDPEPDAAASFSERQRLFKARGGWDSYDTSKLSAGGMIYERGAKSLKLTSQIKKRFNIGVDHITPDDLIRAILKAEVELLWFGGIGTYIKSAHQSHADVDDKTNDHVRVDGWEVRAQVVGEGANLGVTQLGRIEYARRGGRINTDFIDNSGGVDCSDHEVNIKILLADVMAKGKLTLMQRNKLLAQMTDDVASLVLNDNYQQSQSLSVWETRAASQLGIHAEFIRDLEKSGLIRRQLEGLPDKETIARMTRDGLGLTRPELCTLLAYAKLTLFSDIMKSGVPDDVDLTASLMHYFPQALQKYETEIESHKLRREIVATQLANEIVNRMGPVFVRSRILKAGASAGEVAKAYAVIVEAFGARDIWHAIEALDNKIPASVQLRAIHDVAQIVKRGVTWLLRFGGGNLDVSDQVDVLRSGFDDLKKDLSSVLPDSARKTLTAATREYVEAGLPEKLAAEIATLTMLSSANDIISIARQSKQDARAVAAAYFHVGERLGLDWLRQEAVAMKPQNDWQARALSGLLDDFYMQQATLTAAILKLKSKSKKADAEHTRFVSEWFDEHHDIIDKITEVMETIRNEPVMRLEMLILAGQRIGQLAQQVVQHA